MAMEEDGHVKAQQAGQGVGLLMFLQSPWAAFAWFVWRLDFFYQEGFVNPGQFEGSAFWSLLAVLLTWCALLPTLLAVPLIAKRGRTTTPEWNGKVTFFLHFLLACEPCLLHPVPVGLSPSVGLVAVGIVLR